MDEDVGVLILDSGKLFFDVTHFSFLQNAKQQQDSRSDAQYNDSDCHVNASLVKFSFCEAAISDQE
jgi:hypothetical protein